MLDRPDPRIVSRTAQAAQSKELSLSPTQPSGLSEYVSKSSDARRCDARRLPVTGSGTKQRPRPSRISSIVDEAPVHQRADRTPSTSESMRLVMTRFWRMELAVAGRRVRRTGDRPAAAKRRPFIDSQTYRARSTRCGAPPSSPRRADRDPRLHQTRPPWYERRSASTLNANDDGKRRARCRSSSKFDSRMRMMLLPRFE